jgi:hypothetical protein
LEKAYSCFAGYAGRNFCHHTLLTSHRIEKQNKPSVKDVLPFRALFFGASRLDAPRTRMDGSLPSGSPEHSARERDVAGSDHMISIGILAI